MQAPLYDLALGRCRRSAVLLVYVSSWRLRAHPPGKDRKESEF